MARVSVRKQVRKEWMQPRLESAASHPPLLFHLRVAIIVKLFYHGWRGLRTCPLVLMERESPYSPMEPLRLLGTTAAHLVMVPDEHEHR